MSPRRIAWIVTIPLTLACSVLAGLTLTNGGGALTVLAGALAVMASHLALRFLHGRSPMAAWSVVWLAVAICFAMVFRWQGDSWALLLGFAALFASLATVVLVAVAHLGPWNPAVARR